MAEVGNSNTNVLKTNENPQGFYFNQRACIGCRTCQIACKDKNNLEVGMLFRRVETYETGTYPLARTYHLSATCNNCREPACVSACPVGAMYIDSEDGTTQHDDQKCIGCQYCVKACPYGVPQFDDELNISRKCDSCIGLREKGEDPACVASCVMRAIEFGVFDELKRAHSDAGNEMAVLPVASITSPSLLVSVREAACSVDYRQLIM